MSDKSLLEEWRETAYNQEASKAQLENFWGNYFNIEKKIYEILLTNPDEEVKGTVKELAEKLIEDLELVTPGVNTPVGRLSGGHVQKVLLGREIACSPSVLIVAYPVRGLDINSSYRIYDLLNEQKKKGVAVIFIGEDLDVLMEISDRLMVLCGGKVSGIVDPKEVTKEEIGLMMIHVDETAAEENGEEVDV